VRQWYVLRSKPRKEAAASSTLASQGVEVYLPLLRSRPVPGGTARVEPLFPGYFFGRLDPHTSEVARANRTANVLYVLGCGNEPCSVPDELVSAIQHRLAAGAHRSGRAAYRSGDPVVIIKGAFEGIEAVFDEYISAAGRVRVLIQSLQSVYRAELDVSKLRSVRHAVAFAAV